MNEQQLEKYKVKKMIKNLESARGNGTSMITLIMPPKSKISDYNKKLTDEFGTATNIKSRVNRLSVLSAIKSTQERLKLYKDCPPNGLVLYCGTVIMDDNKEKKLTIDFEPFRPINTTLYMCDNKFHTQALTELFDDDDKYGFIIMDGNGTLYGVLQGNNKIILNKFSVELPKKHGRGGQSALRFARLRLEKRHNYLRKVAETATQLFITDDKINVRGLILAGSAEFKNDLNKDDLFDDRLKSNVLNIVDVAYGGEQGLSQAIELSSDILKNVKLVQEKKTLVKYFDEISQDTNKYSFGVNEVMRALESGCCELLIIWELLDLYIYKFENNTEKYITDDEYEKKYKDESVVEKTLLIEYLIENYKSFGSKIELISDKTTEGSQFIRGFGGIGCILRYPLEQEYISDEGGFSSGDDIFI